MTPTRPLCNVGFSFIDPVFIFRPICLPSDTYVNYTVNDAVGTVTGWGTTLIHYTSNSINGIVKGNPVRYSSADVLHKITDVKVLGHKECDSILEDYERRTNGKAKLRRSNVCGNSPTGDSCKGDSGSGLVAWNNNLHAYELIGVVSFGVGCNSSFHGKGASDSSLLGGNVVNVRDKAAGGLHQSQHHRQLVTREVQQGDLLLTTINYINTVTTINS